MKTYVVSLRRVQSTDVTVVAESPSRAVSVALNNRTGYTPMGVDEILEDGENVKSFEIVGGCEGCEEIIFEGDDYACDDDGIMVCAKCKQTAPERKG